jgi:hypothetical protein
MKIGMDDMPLGTALKSCLQVSAVGNINMACEQGYGVTSTQLSRAVMYGKTFWEIHNCDIIIVCLI